MEKVIAALWAHDNESREDCAARLRTALPKALSDAGARHIRLNLRDGAVAPADALIQRWQTPQQAAVVQFWMPSANARFRGEVDAALAAQGARFAAWLVCESSIIANTQHPPAPGERCWGWSQASFISFRPDISRAEALVHWHDHHTRVAIETQANFEYIQNIVVRPLTDDAPPYDAFVEECFAPAAMTEPGAFYDAIGKPEKLAANLATMMESCAAFIDFTRIDIVPTSQFNFPQLDR